MKYRLAKYATARKKSVESNTYLKGLSSSLNKTKSLAKKKKPAIMAKDVTIVIIQTLLLKLTFFLIAVTLANPFSCYKFVYGTSSFCKQKFSFPAAHLFVAKMASRVGRKATEVSTTNLPNLKYERKWHGIFSFHKATSPIYEEWRIPVLERETFSFIFSKHLNCRQQKPWPTVYKVSMGAFLVER